MIVFAIGDIHGRADLLTRLLAKISENAGRVEGKKRLIYLGDYVDRGPSSAQVIDTLLQGPPPGIDEQVCLRGNHEQMMLDWYAGRDWLGSWPLNGGLATKRSYGGDKDRLHRHLDWMETLPLTHREGSYLFVHAGIVPGRPLDEQRKVDLMWIRENFLNDKRDHGFTVVHGHTPVRGGPEVRANRINVDTGAVYGGALTCAVLGLPTLEFLSVPQG